MEQRGPWTIQSKKTAYTHQHMRVTEYTVSAPGKENYTWPVMHKAHGSSILPLDEKGDVYLIRKYCFVLQKECYETIGGAIDAGETPLQAAHRELKEESGISVQKVTALGETTPFADSVDSMAYLFLGEDLSFGEAQLEAGEFLEVVKMPLADAVQKVLASEIVHAQSCVLILKAHEHLKTR